LQNSKKLKPDAICAESYMEVCASNRGLFYRLILLLFASNFIVTIITAAAAIAAEANLKTNVNLFLCLIKNYAMKTCGELEV
jgi:hypothetical protein